MKADRREDLLLAIRDDGRYAPDAYEFLHAGLEYTTTKLHSREISVEPQHVSGQELCEGLREFALLRWGYLAKAVLQHWSVRRTRDFGEMVYFLIDLKLMGRQDSDRIEDFDDVYDFDAAFDCYSIPLDVPEE
jgi:uncharacterized repeat protein (TIGR04138 family)